MKVALIHTTINSLEPILNAFNKIAPEIELMNFVDEGLMYNIKENNEIYSKMLNRMIAMVRNAEESGADGILLACSAFSPYVDIISQYVSIPLISADIAMLNKAVEIGGKIGVITTVKAAKETTIGLLNDIAKEKNKKIQVYGEVVDNAFDELKKGNNQIHDRLIQSRILRFSKDYDVIVLAQMSMARSIENFKGCHEHILTSPEISAKGIISEINNEKEVF